jgi:hypothetical protein
VVFIQEDDIDWGVPAMNHKERDEVLDGAYVELRRGINKTEEGAVAGDRYAMFEFLRFYDGWYLACEVC